MAKKEKIVDLKSKPEKVTEEQLKRIKDTVNGINRGQLELGHMEVKKHEMLHSIAGFRDELTLIQAELEKDYGTFDVNIQDGIINYPITKEDVKANKKD